MRYHCRIGKITLKKAPNLSVITTPPLALTESHLSEMHGFLDDIWDNLATDGVGGIVIVGFDMKGQYTRATKIHKDSHIGKTLLPSFVAEVLRCDKVSDLAHDAIDERIR